MSWHTIHVFYYDDNKDSLIVNAVRPLFRCLSDKVDAVSYTRHWREGPHLRLNFFTDTESFERLVQPAVHEIIGGYLAGNPSARRLDPEQELALHRRLAELEQERGPLLPWQPDNTMRVAAYEQRLHILGTPAMAGLLADFHADATELSFTMTEQIGGCDKRRLAFGFDLMSATAYALPGAETSALIAFRSHSEAFRKGCSEGRSSGASWDDYYRLNARSFTRRMHAVSAMLRTGSSAPSYVQDWVIVLRRCRRRAAQLIDEGKFSMPDGDPGAVSNLADASPYHRRLFGSPHWAGIRASRDFNICRFLLNCTYLQLTRIGVTPEKRFLLCHIVASAIEECYEVPQK